MDVSPHWTASHFLCWNGDLNWLFYLILESIFQRKWHCVHHKGAWICYETHFLSFLYICKRIWNTQAAMGIAPYDTPSHCLCLSGTPKCIFCFKFESIFQQNRHSVDHKGIIYAVRFPFNHSYTSKEGYETLKQQWMSLIITHHHISCAEMVT